MILHLWVFAFSARLRIDPYVEHLVKYQSSIQGCSDIQLGRVSITMLSTLMLYVYTCFVFGQLAYTHV